MEINKNHILTNRDISEQYRDIEPYLMISNFLGAFACWAHQQDNGNHFDLICSAIKAYSKFLSQKYFRNRDEVRRMDYDLIASLTSEDIFIAIPEIMALNETKDDFIDLGALSRNVFYHILREQITQPL